MPMNTELKVGWMEWDEIERYLPQLMEMELDLIVAYHYPDRKPPVEYVHRSVRNLQQHMEDGNTFFFGICDDEILLGYSWAYTAMFIDELRWHEHSRYLRESIRGQGYGRLLSREGEKKARSLGAASMEASVAVFNQKMRQLIEESGFKPKRIEYVKKL